MRPDNGESDRAPDAADSTRLLATVEGRPELRLAGLQAERTKLDLLDARSAKAPTLDFSLDAGLAGADLTHAVPPDLLAEDPNATFSDRLRHDLGASAALHLRLPVVDATARGSQRARQSALEAQGVRRGGEATRVRAEAIALFERWRVAYRRLELARASPRARRHEPAAREEPLPPPAPRRCSTCSTRGACTRTRARASPTPAPTAARCSSRSRTIDERAAS